MNCDDIDRQMDAMLDGALDQPTERAIKAHLSFCPTCQSKWEQLTGLRSLLQRVAPSGPSASLESRVMSAYYERQESRSPVRVKWPALLVPPSIPRPAFAMIFLLVMIGALVGAFVLGRVTANQIVMPAVPASTVSPAIPHPSISPESIPEHREEPQLRAVAPRNRSGRPVHRIASAKSPARTSTANPFESFATVSPAGTSYSTNASLDGFEPLRDTRIRVVKGEEQR